MKYVWATIACVLGLAALAAGVTYYCMRAEAPVVEEHSGDSLVWLRHEFELTPEQMARIEKLHAAYGEVCEAHCAAIVASRTELQRLAAQGASGTPLDEAKENARRLDIECRTSLEAHVGEIAEIIGGEQGRRYLATVMPRIVHFDHDGPPDLKPDEPDARDGHAAH